jgi:hypothetical protein
MRSLAPFGMSLPGVGTGRCVRASIGRVDDAETGSRVRPGGAASSKPSRWHVGVRRVGQHASPVRENCAGPLAGIGGFSGGNNCEGGNAGE